MSFSGSEPNLFSPGIQEVQAGHGEPAVVGQQHLFALGAKGLERGFVVGALRGGGGGDQGQHQTG